MVAITFVLIFQYEFYYFTPYASNVIGTSAVFAAILAVLTSYIRPIVSIVGGFVADGFGKAKVMLVGFVTMGLGVVLLMFSAYWGVLYKWWL